MPPKRKNPPPPSESDATDSTDEEYAWTLNSIRGPTKHDIDEKRQKKDGIQPAEMNISVVEHPEDLISSPIKPRLILRHPPSTTLNKASVQYFNEAQCSTCKLFKPITEFLKVIIAIYRKIEYKLPRIQRTCDICRRASTLAFQKRKRRIADEKEQSNYNNKQIMFAKPIIPNDSTDEDETESDYDV